MKDDSMSCPDSEKVFRLLDGPCRPEEERWLESHFAECTECRRELESSLQEMHRSKASLHEKTLPLGLHQKLRESNPFRKGKSAFGSVEDVHLGPPRISDALGALGPYDVLRELGHGGFGVVYLAHDPQVKRDFAAKVIWPGLAEDANFLDRFYEEARKSNEVKSLYVVSVIRVGQPPEFQHPCLIMEYIEGQSLRDAIRRQTSQQRRVDCRRWAAVVGHVAEGLHALHEKGVVHRDVKAANILLDQQTGLPKLTDFGLAFDVGRQETSLSDERAGTLSYMAPEIVFSGRSERRTAPDRRSDVYSLGVVLYECLTGERPFRADTPEAIRRQILDDPPVPPRKRNDAVPRDLETIALKCLSKESSGRYATAEALASDLGRFLANQPIEARRASPLRRVRLWRRRNPAGAALLGLAVVALLSLIVVPWFVLGREQTLRQDAERERNRAVRSNQQRFQTLQFIADRILDEFPLDAQTQPIRKRLEESFLTHFREAVNACDDTTDAYYADACAMYACYAQGFARLEEAREYYRKAIAVYDALEAKGDYGSLENHAKFCVNLANVCHALGRKQEAFDQLARSGALWEELERRNPAAGPRREVGELLSQRGHLKAQDGKLQEALEEYRRAEARFRQLLQSRPNDAALLCDLAGLQRNMGNAWDELAKASTSKEYARNARGAYEEAIALCRRVTGPSAQEKRFLDELAEHYNALAVSAKQGGDNKQSATAYEQSLAIRRRLVEQYPGDIASRVGLGRTLNNVANMYLGMHNLGKARSIFREAVEQRERLVQLRPREPDCRSSLGNTYLLASDVEIEQGDLKAALVLNSKSVDSATEAFRLAPSRLLYGCRLVTSLHDRGQLLMKAGDGQGAVQSYRRAIAYQTQLVAASGGDPGIKANLAGLYHTLSESLAALKQPKEAAEALEAAAALEEKAGGAKQRPPTPKTQE
jgi:serine/threonine protein kinase